MKLDELYKLKNHKIAILWFWKEGKSTLSFIKKLWFDDITILDENLKLHKQEGISYILWKNYLSNLDNFALIFKSPWISPYNEKIIPVIDKIISQAQVFFDNYEWKIIWITWTKWKSTISTLTYETLSNIWYKTKLVWNIGNPVLDEIDIINQEKYDYVVYELSSYMLEWLKPKLFIWIINNIYDCHLDWHNWKQNYVKAKFWILINSKYKLINQQLKNLSNNIWNNTKYFWIDWNYKYKNPLFYNNEQQVFNDSNIALQWEHNMQNICVVVWILDCIDEINLKNNIKSLKDTLSTFSWLPHRMQNIWEYNWITFIDDAIATTQESTIAAINTYEQNIWTILLWWEKSVLDFSKLKIILKKYNIENIVLFPDTWDLILWDLSSYEYEIPFKLDWKYSPNILKTKSMSSAIDFAFKNTKDWKICILSNAAPSYNMWSWYIEKWLEFQKEIKKHISITGI